MNNKMDIPLRQLVWPVFLENLLRISLTSVDVLMLTAFSQKAVAAVGLIQQFTFFIQLLYLMVTVGASIIISQSLGARLFRDAGLAGLGSLILVSELALVLSVIVVFSADHILSLYQLEASVHTYAREFLIIYGGASIFVAINMAQGSILRAWGYSFDPMLVNIIANILNIIGNAICLMGWMGLPVFGVKGVACSTMFSQFVACVILGYMMYRRKDVNLPLRELHRVPPRIYRMILSVGIPTAGENLSYNIGQILIMNIIAKMGTVAMSTYVYAITVLRFVFIPALSIGMGAQIKVGYFAGAGLQSEVYGRVYRYLIMGFFTSLILVCLVNMGKPLILPILTHDHEVLSLLTSVLLISLLHEPGRSLNLIMIPSLKGAGDVRFPVLIGMIVVWGVGVFFSYLFGIVMNLGIVGVWMALVIDEWVRGLLMVARWRSGVWKEKSLVSACSKITPAFPS
ncbi:MAG: MATE family efflux transporter [Oligoflexales bacterium]|nr:MATE family efflux transporter [Oligoflexales bacterium]